MGSRHLRHILCLCLAGLGSLCCAEAWADEVRGVQRWIGLMATEEDLSGLVEGSADCWHAQGRHAVRDPEARSQCQSYGADGISPERLQGLAMQAPQRLAVALSAERPLLRALLTGKFSFRLSSSGSAEPARPRYLLTRKIEVPHSDSVRLAAVGNGAWALRRKPLVPLPTATRRIEEVWPTPEEDGKGADSEPSVRERIQRVLGLAELPFDRFFLRMERAEGARLRLEEGNGLASLDVTGLVSGGELPWEVRLPLYGKRLTLGGDGLGLLDSIGLAFAAGARMQVSLGCDPRVFTGQAESVVQAALSWSH